MLKHIALAAMLASPLAAETTFRALSHAEREVLRGEIRDVLLSHPDIIENAMNPSPYAGEIADDLRAIDAFEETFFASADFALIVGKHCEICPRAEEELAALAEQFDLIFNALHIEAHPKLAATLELDTPPFYIFPETILRGHLPSIVLEPHLKRLAQD